MDAFLLKTRLSALWAWLMGRWLYVLAVCAALLLLVAGLGVLKSQQTKDVVVQAAAVQVLTKKQVRQAIKVIAQKRDSIRIQTVIIHIATHKADSLVKVARKKDAHADSLAKQLSHETPAAADPDAVPARVEELLANYRPAAVGLGGVDSIR